MGLVWVPASRHHRSVLVYVPRFCDVAVDGVSAGSGWRGRNRLLIVPFMLRRGSRNPVPEKGASLMVACFMEYPTRVSTTEQKCSFGFCMYVRHRGAIVLEGSLYDLVH